MTFLKTKEEFKKWANQKGQLVAKEKIEEIYEQFQDILPYLSTKIGNKTDFIDKIHEYRNIMTHGRRKFATIDKTFSGSVRIYSVTTLSTIRNWLR